MKWFILFVGVVFVCFVVAMLLGLVGGGMGHPTSTLSHEPLPDGELTDDDFDDLVFDVGARGYRMSQVDGVVDRLRRELREKGEELAVLRGEAPRPAEPEPETEGVPEVGPETERAPEAGPELEALASGRDAAAPKSEHPSNPAASGDGSEPTA